MPAKLLASKPPLLVERPPLANQFASAFRALLSRFPRNANSAGRALVLEDRVTIGPKKSLVIVRCHDQRFLVATAGDSVGPFLEIAPIKTSRRARKGGEV